MNILVLVKGKKLKVTEHYCNKITVKGDVDKVFLINSKFDRRIRPIEDKVTIEFHGNNLELITKTKDMVVLDGDITKYYLFDKKGKLGLIHFLGSDEFK